LLLRRLLDSFGRISFETRVRNVVLALIVISAFLANLGELRTEWYVVLQPGPDRTSHDEKRFAPLKKVLPERGVVGFVTDASTRSEQARRRYIAGYALAPLLVAPGADQPLVIGDFKDPAAAKLITRGALQVRHDFGDGLVLFAAEQE
jgi:hypothetical protein